MVEGLTVTAPPPMVVTITWPEASVVVRTWPAVSEAEGELAMGEDVGTADVGAGVLGVVVEDCSAAAEVVDGP